MSRFGGRKLWAFIVVFLTATGALFAGVLTGDQWMKAVSFVFAAYAAGNAGEHIGKGLQR